MSKAFVIDIPLYNRDLLVVFGDTLPGWLQDG